MAAIVLAAPMRGWAVFALSAFLGTIISLFAFGSLESLPELAQSPGTWASVAGTLVVPVAMQALRGLSSREDRKTHAVTRTIVTTPNAPRPNAPLSQAVRSGDLIFVSGITPFTLDLKLEKGDFEAQMHQVMDNISEILRAGGTTLAQVVKCTVILARREDWAAMNRIYQEYWPSGDFPARTSFEAPLPNPDFLVEVECVAEVR